MNLKSKFYTIFKSLNPNNYLELIENKFFSVIGYFLFIVLFSVIIMSILFIPFIYSVNSNIAQTAAHFKNFNVTSNFKLSESFNIFSDPIIRLESSNKNISKEFILINPDGISYKRFIFFGSQRDIPFNKGIDIANNEHAQTLLAVGFIFILPALFFWAIILSIMYFIIIILITYVLALTLISIFRISVSMLGVLKMCIYASTIFILLQLLLMPFIRVFLLPLVVYWVLVIIILFLWQDQMFRKNNGKNHSGVFSDSNDSKDIFGNGKNSNVNFKHSTIAVQDNYAVDDHGNLKGSSKRKRSFDEENDGYVELK